MILQPSERGERVVRWAGRAAIGLGTLVLGCLAIVAFGLARHQLPAPSGALPRFEPGDCPHGIQETARPVRCGRLFVAQSRDAAGRPAPDTREISIAVAVLEATQTPAAPDPVIFLDGGPGYGTLQSLDDIFVQTEWPEVPAGSPAFQPYATPDRDWIVIDQRGTGLSVPRLDCEIPLVPGEGELEMLGLCPLWHRLTGVDLDSYNGAAIAKDLADLRSALGYDAWNLVGVSYGSRNALVAARDHGAGLRAMVLDAVLPPNVRSLENDPVALSQVLRGRFSACAADPACAASHPDLEARFTRAIEVWAADRPASIADFFARFTRPSIDEIIFFLGTTVYSSEGVEALPDDLAALMAGDFAIVDYTLQLYGDVSEGVIAGHLCRKSIPFEDVARMRRQAETDRLAQIFAAQIKTPDDWMACDAWGITPAGQREAAPVSSDVPTLLMSAGIDPGTPAENAVMAARTLPRSQSVVIEGATHSITSGTVCGRAIMHAFLADPLAPVDRACLSGKQAASALPAPATDKAP